MIPETLENLDGMAGLSRIRGGDSVDIEIIGAWIYVFPAYAGVIPDECGNRQNISCLSRIRGGDSMPLRVTT